MSDITNAQLVAYNNFIKTPNPQNALDFVVSCYKYISILAAKWHQANMTRKAKINEIISEMYLILLEDFSTGKAITYKSAFSYLDSKLRRLVDPARKHFFSDIEEISPNAFSQNDRFTFEKVSMTTEIVKTIRSCVLEEFWNNNGLVSFLFIHIFPQIKWISELLAKKDNLSIEDRYEADAKRLNRFNNRLRSKFNYLSSGDWKDIINWSLPERRHLAWKIICISPEEVDTETSEYLASIENWRENFDTNVSQSLENLEIAEKVYKSMHECFPKNINENMVAEENNIWSNRQNIILDLIGDFYKKENMVRESECDYSFENYSHYELQENVEKDLEFMEVAQELGNWFGKLLSERNKNIVKNSLTWNY